MRGLRVILAGAAAAGVCACAAFTGLDEYDVIAADGPEAGVADGGSGSTSSSSGVVPPVDGGVLDADAAPVACEAGAPCTLPAAAGFAPVLFGDEREDAPCPAGWASTSVRSNPRATSGACTCGACAATVSCATGTVRTLAGETACGGTGPSFTANSGSCTSTGGFGDDHIQLSAPPAVIGACTAPSTPVPGNVTTTATRLCTLQDDACASSACRAPAALRLCLVADGDTACPPTAPQKTVVGEDVTLACPACGCTLTATCNGTFVVHDKPSCTGTRPQTLAAGVCTEIDEGPVRSFEWTAGTPTTSCTKTPPAPAVTLVNPKTVCCP